MKGVGRNISKKERILILILALIVLYLLYDSFVRSPLEERISNEQTAQADLQKELQATNDRIKELEDKKAEMAGIDAPRMPSYNAEKEENGFLATITQAITSFSFSREEVKRSGYQIRRSFSCSFTTETYDNVEWVLKRFSECRIRCLLEDVKFSQGKARDSWDGPERDVYSVSLKATFYETLYDGEEDSMLPPDSAAAASGTSAG